MNSNATTATPGNSPALFAFEDALVRVIADDGGSPWFVAKDSRLAGKVLKCWVFLAGAGALHHDSVASALSTDVKTSPAQSRCKGTTTQEDPDSTTHVEAAA